MAHDLTELTTLPSHPTEPYRGNEARSKSHRCPCPAHIAYDPQARHLWTRQRTAVGNWFRHSEVHPCHLQLKALLNEHADPLARAIDTATSQR